LYCRRKSFFIAESQKTIAVEIIILAGGLGTRLRSVVKDVPKCMAPVADRPFLAYLLQWLLQFEVDRVILSVGYLRDVIKEWMASHPNDYPFEISYAVEEEPLGTGGGIRLAMEQVKGKEAVILNGDTFFDVNLNQFIQEHHTHNALLSMALKPMRAFDRYGAVESEKGIVRAFKEKQYCAEGEINGGVYLLNKENPFFDALPAKFSFETDILHPYCKHGAICGSTYDGYFIDIGIPEDYQRANREFPQLFERCN
jgi:D-glycero-alpha-D-manno-heptose 1-phosphate guanylyltransferase